MASFSSNVTHLTAFKEILSWPKSSFGVFHDVTRNQNEVFGQPNSLAIMIDSRRCLCSAQCQSVFKNFLFCIGVEPDNNPVTVSGGQQRAQPYIYVYLFS